MENGSELQQAGASGHTQQAAPARRAMDDAAIQFTFQFTLTATHNTGHSSQLHMRCTDADTMWPESERAYWS